MDAKVANFLSTLSEPRFTSKARDPKQPFVLKGVLDGKEIEFFASATDPMPYGRELHRRIAAGELGEIGAFTPPEDERK